VTAAAAPGDREGLLRDDRVWERVWDRMLGPVERHSIAVAVWRGRLPRERFEARVAVELARRWRSQAVGLAIVWALWSAFWGAIAMTDWRGDAALSSWYSPGCALLGLTAIGVCLAVRRRLRRVSHAYLDDGLDLDG